MKTGLLLLFGSIIGAGLAWITMQAVQQNCFEASYADAVVYAGATDFVFELASGEKFSIRSSNDGSPISGSTPLLGPAHEGPAEATTDRLGRIHLVCVANDGVKIRLSDD